MLLEYNFAVVPVNVFVDIQSPFVMERTIIQNLVANHIDIYSSSSKEEQNILFSYIIHDQKDARKFLDRLPLRMAQGSPLRLTYYYTEQIYLPAKSFYQTTTELLMLHFTQRKTSKFFMQ